MGWFIRRRGIDEHAVRGRRETRRRRQDGEGGRGEKVRMKGGRRGTTAVWCGGNTTRCGGGRATPCYLSIITLQDLDLSLQPVVSF